ncbi:MAG: DUF3223 domain-containing protein [Verrucomicrobia bacterium]|nr:DUF3223 domain-containing protein [Verrucomicrobiota bacterium]
MAKHPVQIGPCWFPSRKSALEHVRKIVAAYADFERLQDEDHEFVCDLLARHSEAEAKIGCGIHHFYVRTDERWGKSRHFVVAHLDGSETDFSFLNCIEGPNPRRDSLDALRAAIVPQILSFRDTTALDGRHLCPYTGERLTRSNVHIDHIPPDTFNSLAMQWASENCLDIRALVLVPNAPNQLVRELLDGSVTASWTDFHLRRARLCTASA